MKYVVTESQYNTIIVENVTSEIKNSVKLALDYGKNLKRRVQKQLGVSFRFLLTWGAAIGGVGQPLEEYLRGEHPELTEEQIVKIMVAALSFIFYNNKKAVLDLFEELKEEGLSYVLKKTIKKGNLLMGSFKQFIKNLALLGHQFADVMSYTYMIPLVGLLDRLYNQVPMSEADVDEIVIRLLAIGGLTIAGNVLKDILMKIVDEKD